VVCAIKELETPMFEETRLQVLVYFWQENKHRHDDQHAQQSMFRLISRSPNSKQPDSGGASKTEPLHEQFMLEICGLRQYIEKCFLIQSRMQKQNFRNSFRVKN